MTLCFRRLGSNLLQASPSRTDDQRRLVIWGDNPSREREGSGGRSSTRGGWEASRGDAEPEGAEGGAAAGPLPGGGGRPANSIFHHRLPTPGAPARIAFAVRISKAAPGLFRSGNLIRRGVYFSTLENSQCRTDPGRTQPADAASGRLRAAGQGARGAGTGGAAPARGTPTPADVLGREGAAPGAGPGVCAHSGHSLTLGRRLG